MSSRALRLVKGLAATTALVAIVAGVPAALALTVGWPLPHHIPAWGDISRSVRIGDIPDRFWLGAMASVLWLAWALFTASILVEVVAAVHRRPTPNVRMLVGQQHAARLVGAIVLMFGLWRSHPPFTATGLTSLHATAPPAAQLAHTPMQPPAAATMPANADISSTRALQWTVGRRDTLWSIAEQTLSSGRRARELYELNRNTLQPDGAQLANIWEPLRPGWVLTLPDDARTAPAFRPTQAAEASARQSATPVPAADASATRYTVQKGDSFWSIAAATLQQSWQRPPTDAEVMPYWRQIVAVNVSRLVNPDDPNLIYPGQVFDLPPVPRAAGPQTSSGPTPRIPPPAGSASRQRSALNASRSPAPPITREASHSSATNRAAGPTAVGPSAAPNTDQPDPSPHRSSTAHPGHPSAPDRHDRPPDSPTVPIAVVGAAALIVGGIMWRLGRLRRLHSMLRRPSQPAPAQEADVPRAELQARAIAADERVAWMLTTSKLLTAALDQATDEHPQVVVTRVGSFGVEVLLDRPAPPGRGFTAADNLQVWQVDPTLDLSAAKALAADDPPATPALVALGDDDQGTLLFDLQFGGVVAVEGSSEHADQLVQQLIVQLRTAPWATDTAISVVGPMPERITKLDSVTVTTAEKIVARLADNADNADNDASSPRWSWPPEIIVITTDLPSDLLARLSVAATTSGRQIILVSSGHNPAASTRLVLDDFGQLTVDPVGIRVTATQLPTEFVDGLVDVVVEASETPPGPVNDNGSARSADPAPSVASNPAPDPPPAVDQVLEEVLAPCPVEVAILGASPTVTGDVGDRRSNKPRVDLVVYLATHGKPVSATRLKTMLWPHRVPTAESFRTIVSRTRRWLAGNIGSSRLVHEAREDGEAMFYVTDDVGCDWQRFQRLTTAAAQAAATNDEIRLLRAALDLVADQPFSEVKPGTYGWAFAERETLSAIEVAVADAAYHLGELALEVGDATGAEWAARRGQRLNPGYMALFATRMQARAQAGDPDGVDAAYTEAQRALAAVDPLEEVPEDIAIVHQRCLQTARTTAAQREAMGRSGEQ